MKPTDGELEKALDRAVFGTNDPDVIRRKVEGMAKYLEREESSLGHSLAGIRHRERWTLQQVATKAGISTRQWQAWEGDFETPTPEELKSVLKRIEWSGEFTRLMALRDKAPRVRLQRLTRMRPEALAARGVCGVTEAYEWQALDEELKEQLHKWGTAHGFSLPKDLFVALSELEDEAQRENWMNQVLEG